MVKISVIMPVYNGEHYLHESLDSLVNQTMLEDMEVIMIDDGSTDKSRYIVDQYALDYENFFAYHIENQGVCFARNYGIELAKGEYIHFMDADDILEFKAYEKLYNLALKENVDVVMGNFLRFNKNRTWCTDIPIFVFNNVSQSIENTNLIEHNELTWDMFIWNKLYKREFLKRNNIRFPDKNLTFQDNLFSIQVYVKAENVAMLNDYVYFWRRRENNTSITQIINIKWANDRFEILNMVHDFINENISDRNVEYVKYLKWLNLDLPNLINKIQNFPKNEHGYLFENMKQIINLVPEDYFNYLNSYNQVLFSMMKNGDFNDVKILTSHNLKRRPGSMLDIKKEYLTNLNLEEDGQNEELNVKVSSVSIKKDTIKIKVNYFINYINMDDEHSLCAFLKNENEEIPLEIIDKKIFIPKDILSYDDYKILIRYESNSLIKESYLKSISRHVYHIDDDYVYLFFDKYENFHLKKDIYTKERIMLKNLKFENNQISFYTESKLMKKVQMKDITSLNSFDYESHHLNNNYMFNIKIDDLLKSPVKKWELYNYEKNIPLKLNKYYEFINDKFIIRLNNYGNIIMISLEYYESKDKINELKNNAKHLRKNLKRYERKNKFNEEKIKNNIQIIKKLKKENYLLKSESNNLKQNNHKIKLYYEKLNHENRK